VSGELDITHGYPLTQSLLGDAFSSNPQLASQLKNSNIDTIVAFGIQSECCVLSTCRGALAAGFKVILLQGAHSTYDYNDKTAREFEIDVELMLESAGAGVEGWRMWKPVA